MMDFEKIVEKLEGLNLTKAYLLIANVFLIFFVILFSNLGYLPFSSLGDFIFFSFIVFALALYRPGWAFLLFVGAVAIENISLAPESLGINVRLYQLIGLFVVLGVGVRYFSKRLNFSLPKVSWIDWVAVVFALGGFLSLLGAADRCLAFKQAVIVASFVILYFLTRVFVNNLSDLKRIAPFFLGSSFVVILYSIWQNWMFQKGVGHFEVMPGRPNATFSEPDWLGMFLVFVLAMLLVVVFEIKKRKEIFQNSVLWVFLLFNFTALVLTVARSAWLGAAVVVGLFLLVTLIDFVKFNDSNYGASKEKKRLCFGKILKWKMFFEQSFFVLSALIVSFLLISVFNLTDFELGGRVASTTSGLQEITIACKDENVLPPSVVAYVSELEKFGCEHINLEEIEERQTQGMFVEKIQRKDPNVNIRSEIYQKSWSEIKSHPILGIGWGSISEILGNDERGAGLNSSNILLEVWLGAGLLGLICFLVMVGNVFFRGIVLLKKGEYVLGMIFVLGMAAILVPNMFNAGIMLGFLWVFLGISNVEEK